MDPLAAMHATMPGAEAADEEGPAAGPSSSSSGSSPSVPALLRQQLGSALLAAMVGDADVSSEERAALTSASASLDSIRRGVKAVLRYLQRKGEGSAAELFAAVQLVCPTFAHSSVLVGEGDSCGDRRIHCKCCGLLLACLAVLCAVMLLATVC
jgi:hypothetical protein